MRPILLLVLLSLVLRGCGAPDPVAVPSDTPDPVDTLDAAVDASPPCTPSPGECWLWVRGGPWGDEHLGVCCDETCTCDLAVWREHDPHLTMAGVPHEKCVPGDLDTQAPDGAIVTPYTCDPACICTWTTPARIIPYSL